MPIINNIKSNLAKAINSSLGADLVNPNDIVYPPNPSMGDLSLPCFILAKTLKTTPILISQNLKQNLQSKKIKSISDINSHGPYLNFKIKPSFLNEQIIKNIIKKGTSSGKLKAEKKQTILIEYSNANTHKEYHIGHLRNIAYGDAIFRILKNNGHNAIPISYINDFGVHVAKTLWHFKKHYKSKAPKNNEGEFLGKVYAESTQKITDSPNAKEEVSTILKNIESRTGPDYKLWQKTRAWSISLFDTIYRELDVNFKTILYENEFLTSGLQIVDKLLKKNILIKSKGALIADLEKYDLGVLVIKRADGTALYPVADLALAIHKIAKFKLNKSIYVVDTRQSLYFKQLSKLLTLAGFKEELIHLGYDFVKLPDGMMSSRTGNIVTYKELKSELIKASTKEIKKRHKDWSTIKTNKTATILAIATMKFEMLKVDAHQTITFDIKNSLKFEGYTAGYLEYTYARINSIQRKKRLSMDKADFTLLSTPKEHDLILKLSKYNETTIKAGDKYNPSLLAKYLFELAQLTNDYYHSTPILKEKNNLLHTRLALITAINQIINNGLSLLGIATTKEM